MSQTENFDFPADAPEKKWPAVPIAYEYVRPLYEMVIRRLDVTEDRIRGTLTLATSVTLAAPVLVTAVGGKHGNVLWFVAAIGALCLIAWFGLTSLMWGKLRLPDPESVFETTLHLSPWEFQKAAIQRAAEDFRVNRNLVLGSQGALRFMSLLLILEAVLLAGWALSS